jgi:hypothetical protein
VERERRRRDLERGEQGMVPDESDFE